MRECWVSKRDISASTVILILRMMFLRNNNTKIAFQWSAPFPDIKLEERGKIFGLTEEPTDVTEETSTVRQDVAVNCGACEGTHLIE